MTACNACRRDDKEEGDEKKAKRKRGSKTADGAAANEDPEIAEANRLRASLGLKPLRV